MQKDLAPSKLRLEDIYFVLFRRKWLILAFFVAGLVSAAAVWKMTPTLYGSKAMLLVRYIVETTTLVPPGSDEQVRQVDSRGDSLLNTEVSILTSQDLISEVVEAVGAERILEEDGKPGETQAATGVVLSGLLVEVPRRSTVIHVSFFHPDPEVTRDVLRELTRLYVAKHQEIHQSGNTYDLIARKTDEMKLRLRDTEEDLQELRAETHGVSLPEAKAAVAGEMESLRRSILETESELAASMAMAPKAPEVGSPRQAGTALEANAGQGSTNRAEFVASEVAYAGLMERLRGLRLREQDYLVRFKEENPLVKSVRQQIVELEAEIQGMVAANPQLALTATPVLLRPDALSGASPTRSTAAALMARLNVLTNQFERVRAESMKLSDLEKRIAEIQLSRDIQQENLRYAATSLEQARYGSALEFGRNSNISVIQEPSNPTLDMHPVKIRAAIVLGGLAGAGLALAFLLELIVDPRVKRTSQLEARSDVPILMTIPRTNQDIAAAATSSRLAKAAGGGSESAVARVDVPDPRANGQHEDFRGYFEGLRDRLILYFENLNLRRKPKLIGVAGCHRKCGASTVADGLATTLSETGGGKVLLVDLSVGRESARPYQNGTPAAQLTDLLSAEPGLNGEQERKLILARVDGRGQSVHPVRTREFDMLLPKLKASDFDYIVFDLPPVTPTSVTFRMAGFLDRVLLVAEAERTHLEMVGRAESLLKESNSRIGLVLNKTREYLPRWLREPL